jgi:hypothetical protein
MTSLRMNIMFIFKYYFICMDTKIVSKNKSYLLTNCIWNTPIFCKNIAYVDFTYYYTIVMDVYSILLYRLFLNVLQNHYFMYKTV